MVTVHFILVTSQNDWLLHFPFLFSGRKKTPPNKGVFSKKKLKISYKYDWYQNTLRSSLQRFSENDTFFISD